MPLAPYEIEYAESVIGRKLTKEELVLLEAEWSEHCSYKSTKAYLKELKKEAPWVLVGPGRDAGAIKLFDDVALVARIESHNHPSAVDPYNGAATGIGGIVRDVLSLGAKPVLLVDVLYLGSLKTGISRWLASGIIKGISDYGNRIGVPTATGFTWFSKSYERQPLVNVACVGITHPDKILPGRVEPGDPLIIVGNSTGRDGFLGSSFASKPLEEEENLAAIQVGNPFIEKLIIDALTEAYEKGLLKHVKDLGGGGLATAAVETAANNNVGVVIHLDRIHLRENDLSAFEILASESQERMLVVPKSSKIGEILSIFDKYGIEYSVIGYFTEEKVVKMFFRGKVVVEMPVELTVTPPEVKREISKPENDTKKFRPPRISIKEAFLKVISSPRVSIKKYIYEQYDWGVGGRTVIPPGFGDATVIWLRDGTLRGFAASARGNPRYTKLDPFYGAAISLVEAYRRVSAVGALPLAALDNINSGNPEKPHQHFYTVEMIKGLSWISKEIDLPIIGGNVSLYNEDENGNMIDPVTSVLVLGRVDDVRRVLPAIPSGNSYIVLVGDTRSELGGSELQEVITGEVFGKPPQIDPVIEKAISKMAVEVARKKLAKAAHVPSLGGVAVACAKMSVLGKVGMDIDASKICNCDPLEALFSESQGRILYEVEEENLDEFMEVARRYGLKATIIGRTSRDSMFRIVYNDKELLSLEISDIEERLHVLDKFM